MNQLFFIVLIILCSITLNGQTFEGKSLRDYKCSLRVEIDSTINLIYNKNDNGAYGELIGKVKKIKDTIYHISAIMSFGQFCMRTYNEDTLYIKLDSAITVNLDSMKIVFTNGIYKYCVIKGQPLQLFKSTFDKTIFNRSKGKDYVTIAVKRNNKLADEYLNFKIPFGSAAYFTNEISFDSDIVIKNDMLWTIGTAPLQVGHFALKKSGP